MKTQTLATLLIIAGWAFVALIGYSMVQIFATNSNLFVFVLFGSMFAAVYCFIEGCSIESKIG